jgi:superoxide oxidase
LRVIALFCFYLIFTMKTSIPTNPPTPTHYRGTVIALHWIMFGLLIAVFASIELRVLFEKGTEPREMMKTVHFMLGLVVLALVLLRAANRVLSPQPKPAHIPGGPWIKGMAQLAHIGLYAVMIGMPLLGWLSLSAAGKPIPFLGFELPALMVPDKDLSKQIKGLHETLGVASYWLIGLHITAALGHQWILKDKLIERMSLRHLRSA